MGFFDKVINGFSPQKKQNINSTIQTSVNCPSCRIVIDKIPSSKVKCKNCQKYIYVRTDYQTGEKLYLSDKQKDEFDQEKKEFYFQKEWKRRLSEIGISNQDMEAVEKELNNKWGGSPSFNDLIWQLFNRQVVKLSKGTSFHELKMLYWTWALFACEINSDPINLLKEAHRHELLGYSQSGTITEVDILANAGCEECMKLQGKIFKLEELLKENNILPNRKCTHKLNSDSKYSWCRCIFLARTSLSSYTS